MLNNKHTSKIALYIMSVCVIALLAVGVGIEGQWPDIRDYGVKLVESQYISSGDVLGALPTVLVKATSFSSVECGSRWCRENPERTGHQIALNAKYGKASQVYIEDFDKTYDVIQGAPSASNTDIDIYAGSDQQVAKEFGVQYLQIKIIK